MRKAKSEESVSTLKYFTYQSVTTTLLPTEHMVHTHTLVFSFSSGVESLASFCLLAGFALQDDVLLPFAFTYLLVGADLDENGPRR